MQSAEMRKHIKFFFAVSLFLLPMNVSAFIPKEIAANFSAYRIPEDEVRKLETVDHEVCLSRGHSLESEYSVRLYWECRIFLIDDRIEDAENLRGKNKFYLTELKRIKRVIENVIERIESNFETKMEYYRPSPQERRPILKNIDQYYYNLLSFLSFDYSSIAINNKKKIKQVLDFRERQKAEEEKISIEEQLRRFPFCVRFNRKSKEFEECINYSRKIDECRAIIEEKLKGNENQIKFNCKKKSIEEYPDYMALYNSEFEELKSIRQDSYRFDKAEKQRIENRMLELNRLMSGPRLSKNQLINLRKYAEQKCLIDSELEKNLFRSIISNECEKLVESRGKKL
ncbi:MAG: hypothetical protein LBB09_00030 [Rickettsiales bacterium]|jgi:hypothetical protein|nr:hypothetical protein [Rickettsiales bacterium]